MLSSSSKLQIVDNSGAKIIKFIRVIGKSQSTIAKVGDIILASVRLLRNKNKILSKVKKGDIVYAIVTKTKAEIYRKSGIRYKSYQNAAVLITKQGLPIGTRIFVTLPRELRKNKFTKVLSLGIGIF
jgi:large subunit ribosomal protein L14